MRSLTSCFSRRPKMPQPSSTVRRSISHGIGEETSGIGGGTGASTGGGETIADDAGGDSDETAFPAMSAGEGERRRASMEKPPADDVCPICFGDFEVPCRALCGHWYCGEIFSPVVISRTFVFSGSCILQYWSFGAPLQPCKCPMCSQRITKLIPEASLCHQTEVEICKVLKNVGDYNRLFVGGFHGLMLKFRACMKRMFLEMLNPDRPHAHLNLLRIIALWLGVLYSYSPYDFLRIGRGNIRAFDYAAIALSCILCLVGLYRRRRRLRNVRELAHIQAGND